MRILFYFILCLISIPSIGQEIYPGTPARFITKFPFKQLNGGVILIKAQFSNIPDTFNFILDTGSGGISLDSTTAEKYAIPHVPSGRYIYGIAGVRKVDYAPKQTLYLPGLEVKDLDFYINNYEVLTSVYGIKIDGIVGYSFLSRYIVKINFDSLQIRVLQPGFFHYPSHGVLLRPKFRGLPIVPLTVKDAKTFKTDYFFDTGAGLCFLLSKQFAEDSSILLRKRKPVQIQVQGLGGKKRMKLTLVKELQIGSYKFRKIPTYIFDDESNILSYPTLGGLIGNDILRRFNLVLNYPQKEIHLLPNSHFRDPFDYSYTGMTMYSLEGAIYVDDIVKGSPSEKSGFKNGDIVMAVQNNFSGDIEAYKNLLQKTGSRVDVLILRDNKPMLLHLKIGKIR